jgi:hypothetical protein
MTIDAAIELLDGSMMERWTRLGQFLNCDLPSIQLPTIPCPLSVEPSSLLHLNWVKNLADDEVNAGVGWLQEVVDTFAFINRIVMTDASLP